MPQQTHYDIAEFLVRKGITQIVMSPGSRCAPLTIAMARHPQMKTFVIPDERSAAFIALGMAESKTQAVALLCTSGSATLNYYPAIAEAYYRGVPLLILTADRPPELIDQWDGQTIRQNNLYEKHILKSVELPVDCDGEREQAFRLLNEVANVCIQNNGPVHVNIPLREPLYPAKKEKIIFSKHIPLFEDAKTRTQLAAADIKKEMNLFRKMMIVVGQMPYNKELSNLLVHMVKDKDVVIIADHTSNLRGKGMIIHNHDIFLSSKAAKDLEKPDLLITLGRSVLSKKLKQYLRGIKNLEHWQVGEYEAHDTYFKLSKKISMPEDRFIRSTESFFESDESFFDKWYDLDRKSEKFIASEIGKNIFSEFNVVAETLKQIPRSADLHLANSLPTRYINLLQSFIPESSKVFCNRGTSGIDGSSSTAVGHAIDSNRIQVLITGDMAFFYDRNAYWHNYDLSRLRIILLNNHGGGIFRVIKGPSEQQELDEYFDTFQPLNARNTALDFNIAYSQANDSEGLAKNLKTFFKKSDKPKLLEIETEKEANTKHFRHIMSGFEL